MGVADKSNRRILRNFIQWTQIYVVSNFLKLLLTDLPWLTDWLKKASDMSRLINGHHAHIFHTADIWSMELAKKELARVQKGAWGFGGSPAAAAVKENSQHSDEGSVSHTLEYCDMWHKVTLPTDSYHICQHFITTTSQWKLTFYHFRL